MWPVQLKLGVWYLSVTFLLIIIGFIVIRTLVFFVGWLTVGWSVWLLPNFFADDGTTQLF